MSRKVSEQTLRKILERQIPARYGSQYVPSQLATRDEAPSQSRPARLRSRKFGRELHAMGQPETYALLLALYHPGVVEIHEQKMLSRWPIEHPLSGMPEIDVTSLPSIEGTVAVAERLGCLDLHPVVNVTDKKHPGQKIQVAYPYIGDLLLFISGEHLYCINWNIKDKDEAFERPSFSNRGKATERARRKALFRPLLESEYYRDAGIRTQRVAAEHMDDCLCRNLSRIWTYSEMHLEIEAGIQEELIHGFEIAIETQTPPLEVFLASEARGRCSIKNAQIVFHKAIWDRLLRVDMYHPILEDIPVHPEERDVLEQYAEWFAQ